MLPQVQMREGRDFADHYTEGSVFPFKIMTDLYHFSSELQVKITKVIHGA